MVQPRTDASRDIPTALSICLRKALEYLQQKARSIN